MTLNVVWSVQARNQFVATLTYIAKEAPPECTTIGEPFTPVNAIAVRQTANQISSELPVNPELSKGVSHDPTHI